MILTSNRPLTSQCGFTLMEMIVIATISYQVKVRETHVVTIYQELNQYRLPYQILTNEEEGVRSFSSNAVRCQIQNVNYLQNQSLSLDRAADGSWQCKASAGIAKAYLPQACR